MDMTHIKITLYSCDFHIVKKRPEIRVIHLLCTTVHKCLQLVPVHFHVYIQHYNPCKALWIVLHCISHVLFHSLPSKLFHHLFLRFYKKIRSTYLLGLARSPHTSIKKGKKMKEISKCRIVYVCD